MEVLFSSLGGQDAEGSQVVRRILDALRNAPRTTGELCESLDRTTVMQHLRVLEKAHLIVAKKRGRNRCNYLDVSPIQRVYNRWIKDYAAPGAELLERLKTHVE